MGTSERYGCSFFSSMALAIIAGVALRGCPRSLRRLRNRASKPPSRYCFHFRHNVARDGRRRCPSGKTCSRRGQLVQKATGLFRRNLSVEQRSQQRTPENGPLFLSIGHRRRSFPHVWLVRKGVYLTTSPGLLHSGGRFPGRKAPRTRGPPPATAWPADQRVPPLLASGTSAATRPTARGAAWRWALSGESVPRRPAACPASRPATTTTATPCWGPSPPAAASRPGLRSSYMMGIPSCSTVLR